MRKIPRSKLCLPTFEFDVNLAVVAKERAECKVSGSKFQAFWLPGRSFSVFYVSLW